MKNPSIQKEGKKTIKLVLEFEYPIKPDNITINEISQELTDILNLLKDHLEWLKKSEILME